ncbi:meiotically up-regulated 190 protein [Nannizzia gypsea CBS 118893]|uniref:Meiotically up-regulated 190 protein n=1 Tax=Arthroderma gypseum (strain ATCC MYA-4604 / CBS 118893) TaxID=535722 RepID=E4V1E2_ARTGP|nr:meiotically up-regulated 190 protein [Nannizzia gypsea CBS 118893]EFR03857.1 meiotically up-regulated 190 protein [Nannizzia gypsea CBS 118893]
MTTQKKPGGYWSEANPVPTVQQFIAELDAGKADRDKQIDEEAQKKNAPPKKHPGTSAPHRKPVPKSKSKSRVVTDPTTGTEVEIDDVDKEFMKAVREPQSVQTKPSQSLEEYKHSQDIVSPPEPIAAGTTSDVPIHGERTNILFHPTPSISYEPMFKILEKRAGVLCSVIFGSILVAGRFAGGELKWIFPLACCVATGVWFWTYDVIRRGRTFEWHSEKLRGQTATANLIPESAEWLNSFVEIFWGLVNPEMFASVADTIEDVMHASLPGIIENVRIAEIDQGSNPLRVISLRSLPDGQCSDLIQGLRSYNRENKDEQQAAAEEEGGQPYNLECSFAYHAKPSSGSTSAKAQNMHMMVVFYLGVKGLFGVPFPIFVELTELVGTVRLRLQLSPEAPFAKSLTFSLMGMPHIRAGCTPMVKRGINILNLPLISNFVNYAIKAAMGMYVAPKSMSIDLGMILGGDDIQKDTSALGVFWVRIHRANGLSKQDKRGSKGGGSDPYINLSFSKYGKPMYCTRVICDDLNPEWEESAALLVTPELIKADEKLSVELWDSDRSTADDIVGKVELSMQNLLQHPGKMFPITSKLQGMDAGTEMPGELHWEVGYFRKPHFRHALRTDGKDEKLPAEFKDHPALQDEKGNVPEPVDDAEAVTCTPPDPLWPSGICTVVIHQVVNLQVQDIKGTLKNRKGNEYDAARSYGESTGEEGKQFPTSYCTIHLNDEPIFRTRAKAVSSKPIFNAGTEKFVRDWRSAMVTVAVRDQRNREHDPILGIVPLKLSDIFQASSQVTRWYPLDGGIGFGRIRISLLFRSVELRLPPQLLGYDVGTFNITSSRITLKNCASRGKMKIRTSGVNVSIPRSAWNPDSIEENGGFFDLTSDLKEEVVLPTKHRYRSAIIFEVQHSSGTANALVWLQNLVDNEETPVDIPIWTAKNSARLVQNYMTEENWEKAKKSPGLEDLEMVGRMQFSCRFTPGFHLSHEKLVNNNDSREAFETWEASVSEGVRGDIQSEVPPTVQRLHEISLVQERDILRQANAKLRRPRSKDSDISSIDDVIRKSMTGNASSRIEGDASQDLHETQRRDRSRPTTAGSANTNTNANANTTANTNSNGAVPGPMIMGGDGMPENDNNTQRGDHTNGPAAEDADRPLGDSDAARAEATGGAMPSDQYDLDDDWESNYGDGNGNTNGSDNNNVDGALVEGVLSESSHETTEERRERIGNKENRRSEWRKHRGVMQWRPARNAAFVKHEATFAMKKVKDKLMGDMTGREPDIRTEVG